jgi:hypothetical protein
MRHHYLLMLIAAGCLMPAALAAADQHLLYVFRAPEDRDGFRTLTSRIEVYDIDDGHRLVRTIALPSNVKNIRGVDACVATRRLYISHYGVFGSGYEGHVLCLDLQTNAVLWQREYASDVDRGAITPDGSKLFMPSGESALSTYFYVIDGLTGAENPADRITIAAKTHNTIASLDGKLVFMSAFGVDNDYDWLHVVDAQTDRTIRRIGPCHGTVRPFTINGKASLAFITTNALLGFQVGDVATGKILFTAKPPASYAQPAAGSGVVSHGISLTADERQCYVVDQSARTGIHVFDVSGVPAKAPVWKKFIDTHGGRETDGSGKFLYGETGIYGQPGWIVSSIDGRYQYPETGEIIDTATNTVVGQLRDKNGLFSHSRFGLEVVMRGGVPIAAGNQFGVGRVTAPANKPPTISLSVPSGAKVAPADIAVGADASDSDGRVAKVEFFRDGVLEHTELGAPYTWAWNDVPAGSYTLTARATDDDGATTTSTSVSVTVKAAPTNVPPRVALVVPSGAEVAPADIAVSADASDSDGAIAKVEFLVDGVVRHTEDSAPYTFAWDGVAAGAYTVVARAYDDDDAVTTSSAIVVTVVAAPRPPTITLAAPSGALVAPADLTFTATASDSDGAVAKVDFLVGGVVRHTENAAPWTWSWNDVAAGTYSVTARATDSQGLTATTAARTVTVATAGTAVNHAPSVTLTVPGAAPAAPANVTLEATASDDGGIAKVEFLVGGVVRGAVATAPYRYVWSGVPAGTYQVAARATDGQGASTTTAERDVVVTGAPANAAPQVQLAIGDGTLVAPATVACTATASDSDGAVAQVQFFVDGDPMHTELSPPYQWSWSGAPAGTHLLQARATDDAGASSWSAPMVVTIDPAAGPALVPPTIALTVPPGALIAPADLHFVATASDADGRVVGVDFYVGGTVVHHEATAPYEFAWNDVPAGAYALTVKATDDDGLVATSEPVQVTVDAAGGSTAASGSGGGGGSRCGLGSGAVGFALAGLAALVRCLRPHRRRR